MIVLVIDHVEKPTASSPSHNNFTANSPAAIHLSCRRLDDRCLPRLQAVGRGRKVRTPQGSVPDNVRDLRFKAQRRPVQQKIYRRRLAQAGEGKGEKVR